LFEAGAMEVVPTGIEIHIDMVTDTICPWCYIGKRRMESAFALFPEIRFTVDWIPYILKLPSELEGKLPQCIDYRELLCCKYGEQSANQMLSTLIKAGESLDIQFDHERPILTNTIPSHCLVQYAKRFGVGDQVLEAIMKAYFEKGRDVADVDGLVEIAATYGLNPEEARRVMTDPQCHEAIRRMSDEVKKSGINSVPTFVVSRKGSNFRLKFSGAQKCDCFTAAIRQLVDPDSLCLASNLPTGLECGGPKKI